MFCIHLGKIGVKTILGEHSHNSLSCKNTPIKFVAIYCFDSELYVCTVDSISILILQYYFVADYNCGGQPLPSPVDAE